MKGNHMRKSFTMYADPSHGWLKVKSSELKEVGVNDLITAFSHIRGEYVYLEEDCDAPCFVNEYEKKYGFKPTIVCKHTERRSRIRMYDWYNDGNIDLINKKYHSDYTK